MHNNSSICGPYGGFSDNFKRSMLIPLSISILATNGVVLFTFCAKKDFSRPAYWFMVSLTVADIFVGCVAIATFVTRGRDLTLHSCLVRFGFTITAIQTSIQCLLWIAIDRYIAIKHALAYARIMTPRKVAQANIFLWTQSLVIGFLPLIAWNDGIYHRAHCSFLYVLSPCYVIFMFTAASIPIGIIFIIYLIIYRQARRHIRKINVMENLGCLNKNNGVLGISSQGWKSLKTLICITGFVMITWCPFLVTTIVVLISEDENCYLKDIVGTYLLLLGFSNSFFNPLIYAFRSKDFRVDLFNMADRVCHKINCNS